jgi:hypothetical protein
MPDGALTGPEAAASAGTELPAGRLVARARLACATRQLCAIYLDALCRGETGDRASFARALLTDHGEACAAFIAAWQQDAGVAENNLVVETAAKGFARIPEAGVTTCALVEQLLLDFVHDTLLPASLKLLQ